MDKCKEEIRKAAEEYVNDVCRGSLHRSGLEQYCVVDFMAGAEWQAKQSPWISVDERLPELNERVLTVHRGVKRISIYIMKRIPHDSSNPNNTKWHWSLTNETKEVIAWMPLPKFTDNIKVDKQ